MVAVWLAYLYAPPRQVHGQQLSRRIPLCLQQVRHQDHRLLTRPHQRDPPHVASPRIGRRAQPSPLLAHRASLAIHRGERGPVRVGMEMNLRMVADQELIPVLRTPGGLHEIAKLAIKDPQARPSHPPPRLL
jgi:hypothetical protein